MVMGGDLVSCSTILYLVIGSLTDPGARPVVSKWQWLACPCPPQHWNYRCAQQYTIYVVLRI